jgi:4-aminobutyrate aminotransferase
MRQWSAGSHGTTFGGNPVACAAAVATLEVFREERILDNVRARGAEAMDRLEALGRQSPFIGDVRGKGLMIGLEFVDPAQDGAPGSAIVRCVLQACLDRGLLLYPAGVAGHVLRFIPPLNVTHEDLQQGLEILEQVVRTLPG